MQEKPRILIVDDEQGVREGLCSFISMKFECESVETAKDGTEAMSKLKGCSYDLVLLDIKMPGLSGLDVIRETMKIRPATRFIALSSYDSKEVAQTAIDAGALDFLHKPQTPQSIQIKLKSALESLGKYIPKA